MGIFADFLDSRPMRDIIEQRARREITLLRDRGDPAAPVNYVGRTGWAILKVLSLTQCAMPPPVGELLGYLAQDIDYERSPIGPATARVIANQIAIDDLNVGLEQDLLIHLDLCRSNPGEICSSAIDPNAPSWTIPAFTVNDPIHEWAAYDQTTLNDTDTVTLVPDTGTLDVNLTAIDDVEFAEGVFNGLPAFRFVPPAIQFGFTSASAITFFPDKMGTLVWVGQVNEFVDDIKQLWGLGGIGGYGALFLQDAPETSLIKVKTSGPQVVVEDDDIIEQLPFNVPQIMIIRRLNATFMDFHRNGVLKLAPATATGDSGTNEFFLGYPDRPDTGTIKHETALFQLYDRVLSAGELTTVHNELASAFGVTLE